MDKKLKYRAGWLRPVLSGIKKPIYVYDKRSNIFAGEISAEETRGKISRKNKRNKRGKKLEIQQNELFVTLQGEQRDCFSLSSSGITLRKHAHALYSHISRL